MHTLLDRALLMENMRQLREPCAGDQRQGGPHQPAELGGGGSGLIGDDLPGLQAFLRSPPDYKTSPRRLPFGRRSELVFFV
jgi:hypothetical protein